MAQVTWWWGRSEGRRELGGGGSSSGPTAEGKGATGQFPGESAVQKGTTILTSIMSRISLSLAKPLDHFPITPLLTPTHIRTHMHTHTRCPYA